VHVSRHTQLFEVLLKSGCTQNTETDTAESSQTKIICKIGLSQKGTPIKITPALKVSQFTSSAKNAPCPHRIRLGNFS